MGRFVPFILMLALVLGVSSAYTFFRAAALLRLQRRGRRALLAALATTFATVVLGGPLSQLLPDAVLRPVGAVAYDLELAMLLSVSLLLGVDLLRLLAGGAERLLSVCKPHAQPPLLATETGLGAPAGSPAPRPLGERGPGGEGPEAGGLAHSRDAMPELSRRAFVVQTAVGSAFLVGGASALRGALYGRHDYQLEEVAVPIPGLSRRLDGFVIAQLSDLHLGLYVGEPELRAAESLVRRARPDLLVITGDLIDHDLRYLDLLGQLVRRLGACAPRGLVVIPGNHDYYTGIEATLSTASRAGARVLRNDGLTVGDAGGAFALLGVDDALAARRYGFAGPDLRRAVASVPADLPRILLCHNPGFFPEAAGEVALQLSGHTHGGQVNLLGLRPADWLMPFGYVAGMYRRGGSLLYVNRGFGTAGPPARVGAPPEVTRVVLVSA